MKLSVYLAGKISNADWRHGLVPDLRDHPINGGAPHTENFIYTGPFFISCDHGCFHRPNKHGARDGCSEGALTAQQIIQRCLGAIHRSDLIFAYVTANDCHGTISEITWALCQAKPVVIAFAPEVDASDFWFVAEQALRTHKNVPLKLLPNLLKNEVAKIKTTVMLAGVGSLRNNQVLKDYP